MSSKKPIDERPVVIGKSGQSQTTPQPCRVIEIGPCRRESVAVELPGVMDIDDLMAEIESEEGGDASVREARQWVAGVMCEPVLTLQGLRLGRGLSQAQLAGAIGTQQPNIARMESGRHSPTLDMLKKLAEALEVDLNTLGSAFDNVREPR